MMKSPRDIKVKAMWKCFLLQKRSSQYYSQADLIFSRAGSGAIWESAAYKRALCLDASDSLCRRTSISAMLEL